MRRLTKASSAGSNAFLVLAVALLALLLLAPAANADKGVVGWFGSETQGGTTGGEIRGAQGVDVNSTGAGGVPAGTIYVNHSSRRIEVFTETGEFIHAWGKNVVGINERQRIGVEAEGGTYTLSFGGKTTGPLAFNASATTVRNALTGLTSIGLGNVSTSGFFSSFGVPGVTGTVTFEGTFRGTDVEEIVADGSNLTGNNKSGGPAHVTVATEANGTGGTFNGYEICAAAEASICSGPEAPSSTPAPGESTQNTDLAVDQTDGSVYVTDRTLRRVTKFTATGTPLFVFGKNVNKTKVGIGGSTEAERNICTVASGDICQSGAVTQNGGGFGSMGSSVGSGVAVVPAGLPNSGNVIATDFPNRRFQEFTSSGEWVRAFGWDIVPPTSADNLARDEVQAVSIPGTDGSFTLKFGSSTTPAIPYDASAVQVEAALNALSAVSSGGGSVSVSGGPGDASGSSPYVVTFDGGPRSDVDVAQIEANGRGLGTAPGQTVECAESTFSGNPIAETVERQWLRNGEPIPGETSLTYDITAADVGAAIQCQVFAFNDGPGNGMTQTTVPVVNVSPLPGVARPSPPANLPSVTATFLPGQNRNVGGDGGYKIHCHPGAWSGSPTFSYQWYRSGVPLSGHGANTATYIVQPEDLETSAYFQCAVTGSNASGAVTLVTRKNSHFEEASQSNPLPFTLPSAEPSQIKIPDLVNVATPTQGANFEECTVATECRMSPAGSAPGQFASFGSPTRVAVDSLGHIYTTDLGRVQKFTPQGGPPGYAPEVFGEGPISTDGGDMVSLEIGPEDIVLVLKEMDGIATPVCLDGNLPAGNELRIYEVSADGETLLSTDGVCARIDGTSVAINRATEDIYVASTGSSGDRLMIIGGTPIVPTVSVDDPTPTTTTARVTGTVNPTPVVSSYPNPPGASWRLEYKQSDDSEWIKFRNPKGVGSANEDVPFATTLTPLLANTSYDVRVIATKEFNASQAISAPKTFVTDKSPPAVLSAHTTGLTATSANLHARIDPRGTDTSYYFEWGTTPEYGNLTPQVDIGAGQGGEAVTAQITGLEDVPYHFRVVAENEAGKVVSENQTFAFHPQQCPNALVRQQTGAGYLPDCRAYELVSPAAAGNTMITTFKGPSSPYATNPARLAYVGQFSTLPVGGEPPNTGDLYVSTRTGIGWTTKFIGLPSTESYFWGGPPGPIGTAGFHMIGVQTDPALSKVLLWFLGNQNVTPSGSSNAPYVFTADGSLVERWPTNLEEIAGGEEFQAEVFQLQASGDLSHFVFSSDIPFLPGAGPSAIYDNDTVNGTLQVVSKDPGGSEFAGYPVELSEDGSHILMSTSTIPFCPGPCPPIPPGELYMRVGGHTYDVTGGVNGTFAGMTRDGSKVYFTSTQQAADDSDGSLDLFMWSEATDTVTRVSEGSGGTGNTDACEAVEGWTQQCDIDLIAHYERQCNNNCGVAAIQPGFHNGNFARQIAGTGGRPENDNFLASQSGDIYFYSPEKLAGPGLGAEGMQNLYTLHQGEVQFVATFDPEPVCRTIRNSPPPSTSTSTTCASGPIGRMQVADNGDFAAFSAVSRLTGFDNAGIEMMYRYRPSTDSLICVSCSPKGDSPGAPVNGSMNGRFLTEDGRAFFSTTDRLIADDTNEAQDVYEYVDGRPRLITAGTGAVTQPLCPGCGLGQIVAPGLIGVSADGQDVYFGTYDVLVAQDKNGGNLKIYDARTGGGFPVASSPAPCEAADECHGPASSAPARPAAGTGVDLGDRGNLDSSARNRCALLGRKAKRMSRRAEALRRQARRITDSRAGQRRSRRAAKAGRHARRLDSAAKRCRTQQRRARAGRRAGK